MPKNKSPFQSIRTEGALLPPDILQRIASLKVDGARAEDYHLPPGFKVKEAITASWTSLRAHWANYQEAISELESSETGTAVTNERWLLPLFKELDYGRLTTDKSPVIDEKSYPIERFYNHTPIHLIGWNLPLDRRTAGARGAATASPHSMMQEFLNRSDDHLWAFVSNGRYLRILRDNISLSRQAFVEFDLEAMFGGEVYSDFALMWLLCHQSRVEAEKPEECWLENWSGLAREQGTRVLKDLRLGVRRSIDALGQGFISHPKNDQLIEKLKSGNLSKDEYYRQLLRIVYRLLFLFVAEDRELLHPPDADPQSAELYDRYYSTRRLREMSLRIRGRKHSDLWHSLSLVFDALGRDEGRPEIGLVGLGSFLWRSRDESEADEIIHRGSTRDLLGPAEVRDGTADPVYISNDDLLLAIRALAYVEQDRVTRVVDYRNLGSEELGSVYESLLELNPLMQVEARSFSLSTAAGNERKTSGSYYTPDSLVQCLLDSALEPVVAERLKEAKSISRRSISLNSLPADLPDWTNRIPPERRQVLASGNYTEIAEQAILALTVCDPASGSGHFLIAAAHRLARQLARVRTGESEPSPEDHQHALRDIISRCIYGVDINPMAVELCKVSLWMEAIEPGRALSFLDHHILCGNSLLGTTPALLKDGIPDDAFKPIEGDIKDSCSLLKKRNKRERQERASGQGNLFEPFYKLGNLPGEFARLSIASDDSPEALQEKEKLYADLVRGSKYLNARLLADTWCAVFVWKKDESDLGRLCPTEADFRRIENNPHSILPHVRSEIRRLSRQYQFFHWHLAFPDVFVLPEEAGKPENEQTGWSRGFDVLLGNPPWVRQESLGTVKHMLCIWPSFSSTADLSVFFVDLSNSITTIGGRIGLLTPNKWLRNKYGASLRKILASDASIKLLVDFGHSRNLFPGVDTFPAITVLEPTRSDSTSNYHFDFLETNDRERENTSLKNLVNSKCISIPRSSLREGDWQLEPAEVTELHDRLSLRGRPLQVLLESPIRRGVNTGLNDAFLIDTATKEQLERLNPECSGLIHPWARGADVKRWRYVPTGTHLIFTRRGTDLSRFPAIEEHLAKFKERLTPKGKASQKGPGRKPGPYEWYEIQDNTAYFEEFHRPKLLVPTILYYSEFAFVETTAYPSSKANVIPTEDKALLAILNSNVMWWIMHRRFVGMKDDALSAEVNGLNELPIPEYGLDDRRQLGDLVESAIETEPQDYVRHHEIEASINEIVNQLFQLTDDDLATLRQSEPPRAPMTVLESHLSMAAEIVE